MEARIRSQILSVALCVLGVGVFHGVGSFEFLNYDDPGHVSGNAWVKRGLTPETISHAFVARDTNLWHPFTWVSHMTDVEFFGLDAGRHHLVNLALHLANSLLLFVFLRMATGMTGAGFVVAALFAVHPLHVESVAWISERKGLLAAFFWLLGLIAYARYQRAPSVGRYLAVTAALIGALLSKPVAVTFPVVLLVLDIWPFSRLPSGRSWFWRDPDFRKRVRRLILEKVPWLVLAAGCAVATILIQSGGTHSGYIGRDPLLLRGLAAIQAYADYVVRTFWPIGLIPDYPEPEMISLWRVLALLLAGLGVTVFAVRFARRWPWVLTGWLWFLIVLVPTSGIVDLGRVHTADRYTYLPIIGIFLMVCWSGRALSAAVSLPGRVLIAAGGLAAILGFGWMSRSQAAMWSDSETLFRNTLRQNPTSQIALTNLGRKLQQAGRLDEAAAHYETLLEEHPGYYLGHYNLGAVRAGQLRHADAESHFRRAVELNPGHLPSLLDLSTSLARQGRASEARPFLEQALRIDPANEAARRRLRQIGRGT